MLMCCFITLLGFLSGVVMYSYIIPKAICGIDVRTHNEDGNPGGMNAITTTGAFIGGICLALDILKAFIPVFVAVAWLNITDYRLIPIMTAPVLGHAFTPFFRFKGGKAIAVSFGALLGTVTISQAVWTYVLVLIFVTFIIVLNPDSVKSIIGFALSGVLTFWLDPIAAIKISAVLISLIVCFKHLLSPNKSAFSVKIVPLFFDGKNT